MQKTKQILPDILSISIQITRGHDMQEWHKENVAPGYALEVLKEVEASIRRNQPLRNPETLTEEMRCNTCGNIIDPNDNYCPSCGTCQEK